ncbi:MAG: methyltransferase domain-containing protein [Patescibacteria group bacterium]|jgi:tRNA (guanine10-N2)-dimethyltransferase
MQYIFILGNTPKLSLAEIKAVLPDLQFIREFNDVLIVESPKELDANNLINELGGTIKIAAVTSTSPLQETEKMQGERKKFGFSLYRLNDDISNNILKNLKLDLKKQGLKYKKELRAKGIRSEVIESKDLFLSSVIISKEKCLDIIALVDKDNKIIYGKTLAVQPFREYSARDYDRPSRDPRSGMLPPKVARMMVNIACGDKEKIFLDPFCGSGTILQEALLLGYKKVYGSDISKKAVTDTENNLKFLKLNSYQLSVCDARQLQLKNISTVVSEVYLGPINVNSEKIDAVIGELITLYYESFKHLKPLLAPNAKLVIAFPAWRTNNGILRLPIEKTLLDLGYTIKDRPIIYGRPDARVLREIYIMNGGIQ